ncbi:MAG: tryptophan 2,3-dioxygenase family protein [Meiothermus sp.]|uniref:tryptophan 2,3-dioxygenase family protein n=1 Tax=Meiothermus sp. TaxID=1955249 RepID=UPI0028CD36C2|nr:tryptophan 2,3-dioxygenase family protein [Meiothermus sp.]MDT7919598.1 tryptophan 2,3-dioxygenase family protein [Meiothermus sp.]
MKDTTYQAAHTDFRHDLWYGDYLRLETLLAAQQPLTEAWLTVYRQPERYWDLYYLAEKLVDVEVNFRRWRFSHLTTVERTIGHKKGSGGTAGVAYLKRALEIVLFPELWQVRTLL